MRRQLLLVSVHHGDAGATGGFRWARTLDALKSHGWAATIVTTDPQLENCSPSSVDWIEVPGTRPFGSMAARLRKGLLAIRSHFRRPDENEFPIAVEPPAPPNSRDQKGTVGDVSLRNKVEAVCLPKFSEPPTAWGMLVRLCERLDHAWWARKVYRRVLRLGRDRETAWEAVVVSSPPHWTQLAGLWISRRLGIPLVCDLRDPWVSALPDDCISISKLTRLDFAIERQVLRAADLVIFNTETARELSGVRLGGSLSAKSIAIGNGYDDRPCSVDNVDFTVFRVVFAGFIYPYMDVRVIFRAFRGVVDELGLVPGEASLEFIGSGKSFNGFSYESMARAYGVEAFFERSRRVPRTEALDRQARAAVLVAMDYPYPSAVVMKIYDYLCMPGFILALTRHGSALSGLLDDLGCECHQFDDEERIREFLAACYHRWRVGEMQPIKDPLEKYSRDARTREIQAALESVASSREPNI